ncbi:hypothetical protein [Vagococcus sp. WN89Y]|uniref:hypothetical protein n=1 Tax=Vagococcus sp. WN89Y TaxID=3457258 RepID=UPI003FCE77E5
MTELTPKIYAGALAFWLLFYCFIKVAELRFPPWCWTIMQCITVFFLITLPVFLQVLVRGS